MIWLSCSCGQEQDAGSISSAVSGDPAFARSPALDVADSSSENENRSHFAGANCMGCHQAHGPGPGRYSVSVTVYDQQDDVLPNPVLELWRANPVDADPDADAGVVLEDKLAELQGDALGNVFTTQAIDFRETPMYAIVRTQQGDQSASMPVRVESGACNLCHRGAARVRVFPTLPLSAAH